MSIACKKMISFSLISFAYNEEDLVESQLRLWVTKFRELNLDFEIIIVDDGSTDATFDILSRLKKEIPEIILLYHQKNLGVGACVWTAREYISKDYVFWNDIDSHFDLSDLTKIVPLLNECDLVVAFKHNYMPKIKSAFSWFKSIVNLYLIKLLFLSKVKDFQFVQFYPGNFLRGVVLESRSSFIPAECILKAEACGLKVKQIELHYHFALAKLRKSKCLSFKTIHSSIRDIFQFWFKWNICGGRLKALKVWHA